MSEENKVPPDFKDEAMNIAYAFMNQKPTPGNPTPLVSDQQLRKLLDAMIALAEKFYWHGQADGMKHAESLVLSQAKEQAK